MYPEKLFSFFFISKNNTNKYFIYLRIMNI